MIKKTIKSIFRGILIALTLILLIPVVSVSIYSPLFSIDKPIREALDAVRPLKNTYGQRYCSSVSIRYYGENYTLTNRHCCDVETLMGPYEKIVGTSIEKVLYVNNDNDVCVLTSQAKNSVKISRKKVIGFQRVMTFGYPRGLQLTPRFGHVLSTNYRACIRYRDGNKCEDAIYSSNLIYPGNSGSPLLNMDGRLVGLVYAGNWHISATLSVKRENVIKTLDLVRKMQ